MLPLALALIFRGSEAPPIRKPVVVSQQRRFETNGHPCVLQVLETRLDTDEPDEKVSIKCDDKTILTHDLKDAGIGNIALTSGNMQHTRVVVSWERGTGSGITVLETTATSSGASAKVLFEHFSKCGAEAFENGDVILANVGAVFAAAEILPSGTNVYRWKDGKYVFDRGVRWNKDAKWNDRYCILPNPASCPAEITAEPLQETF